MKFSPDRLKQLVEDDLRYAKQIALDGGFSEAGLSQWASGARTPGANELAALAKVFNVRIEYFFQGDTSYGAQEPRHAVMSETDKATIDEALADVSEIRERSAALELKLNEMKQGKSNLTSLDETQRHAKRASQLVGPAFPRCRHFEAVDRPPFTRDLLQPRLQLHPDFDLLVLHTRRLCRIAMDIG